MAYDPLRAGWQARCPEAEGELIVTLHAFRTIDRIPGPQRPAAYKVRYHCPLCAERHVMLLTEADLDLAPLFEPLAPHYDLMLGRMDWEPGGVTPLWEAALRRGRFPLMLTCRYETEEMLFVSDSGELGTHMVAPLVAGWPSLLRAIEPDREPAATRYRVHYRCPQCSRDGCEHWAPARLALTPPTQF